MMSKERPRVFLLQKGVFYFINRFKRISSAPIRVKDSPTKIRSTSWCTIIKYTYGHARRWERMITYWYRTNTWWSRRTFHTYYRPWSRCEFLWECHFIIFIACCWNRTANFPTSNFRYTIINCCNCIIERGNPAINGWYIVISRCNTITKRVESICNCFEKGIEPHAYTPLKITGRLEVTPPPVWISV